MAFLGESESQGSDSENNNFAIQEAQPSDVVQADVGESFIGPLQRSAPRFPLPKPHVSIKLTQGVKISIRGPSTGPYLGARQGFYKHGFTIEQKEWLDTYVGTTVAHYLWEHGQGDWILLGSRWASGAILYLDFRFRDKSKAMMFKLRWYDSL